MKDNYIISENIIPESIISDILRFASNKFYDFKGLVSYLNKKQNLFELAFKIFPFSELVNEKELNEEKEIEGEEIEKIKNKTSILVLWVELFYILWKKYINYIIKIDNDTYNFNFGKKNNSILNPYFVFSCKSRFYRRKESFFYYIDENQKEVKHKIEYISRYQSYLFYQFIYKFSNYKKYILNFEQFDEAFEASIDEAKELLLFKKFKENEKYKFSFSGFSYQNIKIESNKNKELDEKNDNLNEEDKVNDEDNLKDNNNIFIPLT